MSFPYVHLVLLIDFEMVIVILSTKWQCLIIGASTRQGIIPCSLMKPNEALCEKCGIRTRKDSVFGHFSRSEG